VTTQARHERFDVIKRTAKVALAFFRANRGGLEENCADLDVPMQPTTHILHRILHDVARATKSQYHRHRIEEAGHFILWIFDRDLAYGDQFKHVLRCIFDEEDALRPFLDDTDPASWSINRWHEARHG
jgi:hypothetical protein